MNKSVFIPVIFLITISLFNPTLAQIRVGLDNYYNNEIQADTGKPYHYIWADTTDSGYKQWGDMFEAQQATLSLVKESPRKLLKDVDIYIIVDPDTVSENPNAKYVTEKEALAIAKWVEEGGVLVVLSNNAPNAEFTHFNRLTENFGIHFNAVTLLPVSEQEWEMGAITDLPNHPVFSGVTKIYMKEVCSMSLSGHAKPVLEKDENIIMAETNFGNGHVFAVGDPWIYNEYIGHKYLPASFENGKAAENLTRYLISLVKGESK